MPGSFGEPEGTLASTSERILIVSDDAAVRQRLAELLASAGYEISAAGSAEGLPAVRAQAADLTLLDALSPGIDLGPWISELKGSTATSATRVLVLAAGDAAERVRHLDLGADDVLPASYEPAELLARMRVQLRAKRVLDELRDKTRLAEEGQEIAHTAFQALAVTEKMTRDAFSLDRMLKIGVTAVLLIAGAMAGIFFLYSRRADKETRRAYAAIMQLERGVMRQEDLVARSRKMRAEMQQSEAVATDAQKHQLEKQSEELRAKMAGGGGGDVATLRQQLVETNVRLKRVEEEGRVAQDIVRSYVSSICLLHVVVAFRDKQSGQRLRYAGINPQGEPLQDSEGKPIFTLEGRGPDVRADFFGTGFLATPEGTILTNHHVVEPWWENDELNQASQQGLEAVISEITVYFPNVSRGYRVEVQKISSEADLAAVRGDLGDLKLSPLALDAGKDAAVSGQPLVSIGYATGLASILARAGEDVVQQIVAATNGDPKQVMAELARRNLIRPLTTQGHIGDVLKDKIVYDAQTTSGGSGGPLFNREGKVVGVTYAVVKGFGGSNFGVPIRFALPLLSR